MTGLVFAAAILIGMVIGCFLTMTLHSFAVHNGEDCREFHRTCNCPWREDRP